MTHLRIAHKDSIQGSAGCLTLLPAALTLKFNQENVTADAINYSSADVQPVLNSAPPCCVASNTGTKLLSR